jgi:hypothetical protein
LQLYVSIFPSCSLHYRTERYSGKDSPHTFRYIDFETETKEEYWLISRGFLLLQREASKGRFARQRAMGVSSHVNKLELEIQRENQRREEQSKREEEQANAGGSLKLALAKVTRALGLDERTRQEHGTIRNISDAFQNAKLSRSNNAPNFRPTFDRFKECTSPPPSDFFLGFGSSGTQVRYRQFSSVLLFIAPIFALRNNILLICLLCFLRSGAVFGKQVLRHNAFTRWIRSAS